ncbi:MAG: aa3-type cytochrome c oxidase subunit IV [Pseudomonadota bacterium]|nr:aa3-type cytochrome c oxidase subunit IV [Pseudomonadota bacterium]
MGSDQVNPEAGKMDYPAHQRNYSGFLKMLKVSTIITAIVAAAVILIIAN